MLAILSNVNCEPITRRVGKETPCVENVGYASVLESLLNPNSAVSSAKPDNIVLLIDIREYIQGAADYETRICSFFKSLGFALRTGTRYYISDAYYYLSYDGDYKGTGVPRQSTLLWEQQLLAFTAAHKNCYIFPLRRCIEEMGESAFFSDKAWYLGSVRYSTAGVIKISREIQRISDVSSGKTKKVLLLDLDNTLWGGIAGEDGLEGIQLSDSHIGKAYKEFQSLLKYAKDCGVALAITSKNNEADAWEIIENHPHMLLRKADFAAYRINWKNKAVNIREIAHEMNVGLNSMVFIDDNPLERQEIKEYIPEVIVPDFPEQPEDLPRFGRQILETWFLKNEITDEDRGKTQQYHVLHQIAKAQAEATDFTSFLKALQIKVVRAQVVRHMDRAMQLVQKTNQFNTSVIRYSQSQMEEIVASPAWKTFLYGVEDRFANHGLCALVVVKMGEIPIIDNFIMSCRVMGRNIEFGILQDVEQTLCQMGYHQIKAMYRKGSKNMPVRELYDQSGYQLLSTVDKMEEKIYIKQISLPIERDNVFFGEVTDE